MRKLKPTAPKLQRFRNVIKKPNPTKIITWTSWKPGGVTTISATDYVSQNDECMVDLKGIHCYLQILVMCYDDIKVQELKVSHRNGHRRAIGPNLTSKHVYIVHILNSGLVWEIRWKFAVKL